MRILRLVDPGDFAVEFHPFVTVVAGLDESRRELLKDAFRRATTGTVPSVSGLIEAHGLVMDLDQPSLDLLELERVDVDVVVDADDLPGAVSPDLLRQLRGAERRLEQATVALEAAEHNLAAADEGAEQEQYAEDLAADAQAERLAILTEADEAATRRVEDLAAPVARASGAVDAAWRALLDAIASHTRGEAEQAAQEIVDEAAQDAADADAARDDVVVAGASALVELDLQIAEIENQRDGTVRADHDAAVEAIADAEERVEDARQVHAAALAARDGARAALDAARNALATARTPAVVPKPDRESEPFDLSSESLFALMPADDDDAGGTVDAPGESGVDDPGESGDVAPSSVADPLEDPDLDGTSEREDGAFDDMGIVIESQLDDALADSDIGLPPLGGEFGGEVEDGADSGDTFEAFGGIDFPDHEWAPASSSEEELPERGEVRARIEALRTRLVMQSSFQAAPLRAALDAARSGGVSGALVPSIEALGIVDRLEELERLRAEVPDLVGPTDADIVAAVGRLEEARAHFETLDAQSRAPEVSDDDRQELDDLHDAVEQAREEVDEARFRKGKAKQALVTAIAAERAKLDDLGFSTYTEVLTGGHTVLADHGDAARLQEARLAVLAAEAELGELRETARGHVDSATLEQQRSELLERGRALIADSDIVEADLAEALLGLQVPVDSSGVAHDLAAALEAVGLRVAGLGLDLADLDEMASDWLVAHHDVESEQLDIQRELSQLEEMLFEIDRRQERSISTAAMSIAEPAAPVSVPRTSRSLSEAAGGGGDGDISDLFALMRGEPEDGAEEDDGPPDGTGFDSPEFDTTEFDGGETSGATASPGSDDVPTVDVLEVAEREVQLDRAEADLADRDAAVERAEAGIAEAEAAVLPLIAALDAQQARLDVQEDMLARRDELTARRDAVLAEQALAEQPREPHGVRVPAKPVVPVVHAVDLSELEAAVDHAAAELARVEALRDEAESELVRLRAERRAIELESEVTKPAQADERDAAALEAAQAAHETTLTRHRRVFEEVASLRTAADELSTEQATTEDIEWYLLGRLAAQREVAFGGSVPLLLDRTLDVLDDRDQRHMLTRLERMAGAVQIVCLTDDERTHAWATSLGEQRGVTMRAVELGAPAGN